MEYISDEGILEEKLSKAKQPIQERVQSNDHRDGQTWKKNGGTEQKRRLLLCFFFLFKVFVCLFVCFGFGYTMWTVGF